MSAVATSGAPGSVGAASDLVEHLNPWVSLWRSPRKAIRWLAENDPVRFTWLFAALLGITPAMTCSDATTKTIGWLFALLVAGPWLGIGLLHVRGWSNALMGEWLGGAASRQSMRCAQAWSLLPFLVASALYLPVLLVDLRMMGDSVLLQLWRSVAGFLLLCGAASSVGLGVILVAELQLFTKKRALVCTFGGAALTLTVIAGPILCSTWLYSSLS